MNTHVAAAAIRTCTTTPCAHHPVKPIALLKKTAMVVSHIATLPRLGNNRVHFVVVIINQVAAGNSVITAQYIQKLRIGLIMIHTDVGHHPPDRQKFTVATLDTMGCVTLVLVHTHVPNAHMVQQVSTTSPCTPAQAPAQARQTTI